MCRLFPSVYKLRRLPLVGGNHVFMKMAVGDFGEEFVECGILRCIRVQRYTTCRLLFLGAKIFEKSKQKKQQQKNSKT